MTNHADAFLAKIRKPRDQPDRISPPDIEADSFQDVVEPDRGNGQLRALADHLATEVSARVQELNQASAPTAFPLDRLDALARHFAEISFADMLTFTGGVIAKLPPPGPSAFDLAIALRDWAKDADLRRMT